MNTLNRHTVSRLLIAVCVGIALAVSLNNIAIGIGVATVFIFGVLMRDQKSPR